MKIYQNRADNIFGINEIIIVNHRKIQKSLAREQDSSKINRTIRLNAFDHNDYKSIEKRNMISDKLSIGNNNPVHFIDLHPIMHHLNRIRLANISNI